MTTFVIAVNDEGTIRYVTRGGMTRKKADALHFASRTEAENRRCMSTKNTESPFFVPIYLHSRLIVIPDDDAKGDDV